ncbi:MAG: photosystem II biogenesis protein Psp29 [Microcoleaceae cyanobacterium]
MDNIRTVSDTKRTFYQLHTRPINSIYRRVIEEIMVEMHLLNVNADFQYNSIYALGVVTAFDRFMQGYLPEADKDSIFRALIQAQGEDPQKYRSDAESLQSVVQDISMEDLQAWIQQAQDNTNGNVLRQQFHTIANHPKFKYSRLFAIGLYTLLEAAASEELQTRESREELIAKLAAGLNLSQEKLLKDIEIYSSNLEKVAQARVVMEEMTQAERKKREQRANAKADLTPEQS